MSRLHRAQVLLEEGQYRRLRQLAQARSAQQGRRVSVSQVIRELLDQALSEQVEREAQARAALQHLFTLGERVRARHPQTLAEDWLNQDREEHDHERFQSLFAGH